MTCLLHPSQNCAIFIGPLHFHRTTCVYLLHPTRIGPHIHRSRHQNHETAPIRLLARSPACTTPRSPTRPRANPPSRSLTRRPRRWIQWRSPEAPPFSLPLFLSGLLFRRRCGRSGGGSPALSDSMGRCGQAPFQYCTNSWGAGWLTQVAPRLGTLFGEDLAYNHSLGRKGPSMRLRKSQSKRT